ncbi:MAG: WecB/TagA/CpsF family glycosyltransferase [Candidatus Shapirobacteria bacterium]|nr:WecB/TagA/CpsF family glycosyltransferase [Candidatus Shapirobacteria bacterium]
MAKIDILGVKINTQSKEEILEKVSKIAADNQKHYIVTPNPEFIVLAQKNKEFAAILNKAALAIPDGIGLVWASRLLYGKRGCKERVAGVDLMTDICRIAPKNDWSVFLLGAKDGIAQKCALNLKEKYGLNVLGTHSGWADSSGDKENRKIIKEKIGQKSCHFIFVAYGAGKQEQWIRRNLEKIPVRVAVGVGGSFDFLSGRVKRAPRLFRDLGLEWLWRLSKEPWRWKRQISLLKFVFLVINKKLKNRP